MAKRQWRKRTKFVKPEEQAYIGLAVGQVGGTHAFARAMLETAEQAGESDLFSSFDSAKSHYIKYQQDYRMAPEVYTVARLTAESILGSAPTPFARSPQTGEERTQSAKPMPSLTPQEATALDEAQVWKDKYEDKREENIRLEAKHRAKAQELVKAERRIEQLEELVEEAQERAARNDTYDLLKRLVLAENGQQAELMLEAARMVMRNG